MATPILPTPIIKGKDAERILEELKPIKWTPELRSRLERAKTKFKAMSKQISDFQNQALTKNEK